MTPDANAEPFIDGGTRRSLADMFRAVLEKASPESLVAGGPSNDVMDFSRSPRNHEALVRRKEIYENGGPITEFIDTRALMTYGTGTEFTTTDDLQTGPAGQTVAEWAESEFPLLDEHFIQRGIQTYTFGDAWPQIVEDRAGNFSHVTLADATTVNPDWDRHGQITDITQIVSQRGGRVARKSLDMDLTGHYWFKQGLDGGPLGMSLIEQNIDEIERFANNQEQRANAIRLHGSPHYHVAVGSEGQSISDRLIRRVRDRFSSTNTDEKSNWVTGGEIEISELDSPGFDGMDSITETDIALLSSGFGVPLEYTNFGSDGLGSGKPAESRQLKFERQARAEQRRASQQFIEEILRPVLERYSPFPRDIDIRLEFNDVVSDVQSTAEWMRDFKSYMTPSEVRQNLKLGEQPDDEDLGPPEGTPDAETPGEGAGGLFSTNSDRSDTGSVSVSSQQNPAIGDGGGIEGNANRTLLYDGASDVLSQEEIVWSNIYENIIWDEDGHDRQLFEFDPEEVPQFALDRLEEAVRAGALFEDFETIPDFAAREVSDVMLDSLEQRHGWSVDSIADNLQSMALGLEKQEARTIARTETQALVNDAREQGYEEQFDLDEERFDWVGPSDNRTTDACEWIKAEIEDREGDGVTLAELKDLVAEANDRFIDHEGREWTPHINCRHTFTRVVG